MSTIKTWIVGIDPHDDLEQGYIIHRKAPEFLAKWTIEEPDVGVTSDLVYTDGGEDAVAVYDFEWTDSMPSEDLFRSTMADAVEAIDEYLLTISSIKDEANETHN